MLVYVAVTIEELSHLRVRIKIHDSSDRKIANQVMDKSPILPDAGFLTQNKGSLDDKGGPYIFGVSMKVEDENHCEDEKKMLSQSAVRGWAHDPTSPEIL